MSDWGASTRNLNVMIAFHQFLRQRSASGERMTGAFQAFAALVEIHPGVWSNIRRGKVGVGDAMARRIECRTGKPVGWLDAPQVDDGLSWLNSEEQEFSAEVIKTLRRVGEGGHAAFTEMLAAFDADEKKAQESDLRRGGSGLQPPGAVGRTGGGQAAAAPDQVAGR